MDNHSQKEVSPEPQRKRISGIVVIEGKTGEKKEEKEEVVEEVFFPRT